MIRILPGLVLYDVGQYPVMLGVFLHVPGLPLAGRSLDLVIPLTH
jgi:hypothetical protein